MEMANTGVGAVFYHLYEAFTRVGVPVVVDDPKEPCVELWWVKMCMESKALGHGFPGLESPQHAMLYVYDHQDECLIKGLYAARDMSGKS
jgi:hypothetical protein